MKNPELLREGLARQCYPKMAVFEPRRPGLGLHYGRNDLNHYQNTVTYPFGTVHHAAAAAEQTLDRNSDCPCSSAHARAHTVTAFLHNRTRPTQGLRYG